MGRPSKCQKPLGIYIASAKPFTHIFIDSYFKCQKPFNCKMFGSFQMNVIIKGVLE